MRGRQFQALAATVLLAASAFSGNAIAAGGYPLSFGRPDFDLTGTVYDATTKEPIEGAYVVAIYYHSVVGMGGSNTWCIKTRGMNTGKDGRFNFPVEKLDGRSPGEVTAIKPGYYSGRVDFPKPEVWKKQAREAYSDRDTPLIPQDTTKPEDWFGTGDVFCTRAETRDDAAAGLEFLRIRLSEEKRLRLHPQAIEATKNMIERLESLPSGKKASK